MGPKNESGPNGLHGPGNISNRFVNLASGKDYVDESNDELLTESDQLSTEERGTDDHFQLQKDDQNMLIDEDPIGGQNIQVANDNQNPR